MAPVGEIVVKGVQTTLTYVSVLMVGAFLSQWPKESPLLDSAQGKKTGQLLMLVLMPCLLIPTLGENLSYQLMADGMYVLSIWGLIHIAINTLVAEIVACLVSPPKYMRTEFILALISTNGLSLPLVMMEPLCRTSPLSQQTFGDNKAYDRAVAFIFIYNLPWQCFLFGGNIYCKP